MAKIKSIKDKTKRDRAVKEKLHEVNKKIDFARNYFSKRKKPTFRTKRAGPDATNVFGVIPTLASRQAIKRANDEIKSLLEQQKILKEAESLRSRDELKDAILLIEDGSGFKVVGATGQEADELQERIADVLKGDIAGDSANKTDETRKMLIKADTTPFRCRAVTDAVLDHTKDSIGDSANKLAEILKAAGEEGEISLDRTNTDD